MGHPGFIFVAGLTLHLAGGWAASSLAEACRNQSAKLKPERWQGKAVKSLVQGSGNFIPLLNTSIGMTGLNSNQGKTGNFKPQGAVTPSLP